QTDSEVLASFGGAALGLPQIARDGRGAGYPRLNHFSFGPPANLYAVSPVAWNPTYPATPCQIGTAGGGTCASPGDFDLVIETDINPDANDGVEWVRYQLQGTTLFRGVASKVAGA